MEEELRGTCWVLRARQWKNFPAVPIEVSAGAGCEREKMNGISYLEPGEKGKVLAQGWLGKTILCEEESMAIDPVCGMKVDENRAEFQTQFAGKKYFFCSEDCQSEFENRPDEFATVTAA
jgi:YHS domain-containing protein